MALGEHHPQLRQSQEAPYGYHYPVTNEYKFPHEDENGVCWQPQGFSPDLDTPQNELLWADYEDAVSTVMRNECDLQSWMKVCQIPLYWQKVDCDLYLVKAPSRKSSGGDDDAIVARWIVVTVQILALMWQLLAVGVLTLPLYGLLLSVAVVDWLLDWVFMIIFGWWCLPCAGVFIWIINIALLPFSIAGWIHRFFIETFALVIDGWLLLLGSGCYLRWGNDCWANRGWEDKTMRTWLDIPWFTTTIGQQETFGGMFSKQLTMPTLLKSSDILQVRHSTRQPMMAALPLYSMFAPVSQAIYDHIDF